MRLVASTDHNDEPFQIRLRLARAAVKPASDDGGVTLLNVHHWSTWLIVGIIAGVASVALLAFFVMARRRRASILGDAVSRENIQLTMHTQPKYQAVQINTKTPNLNLHQSQPQPKLSSLVAASQQEPVRIRTKGLLERRGSSASLTLDLTADATYTCMPRECSAEDYLSSAGNRMTRRQLRASLNNASILHQEFLDIPLNHPSKSSQLPGCAHRNRYKSIWPNEKTRVVLRRSASRHENEGAIERTYINANYIRGYDDEPMAFIATQGPLEHTVEDFWLMCWQEKTTAIVMMTKLNEKNKDKCYSYLPQRGITQYGDVQVEVNSCRPANGYYIRDMTLTHRQSAHKRYLKHFWYTSWPDHSAPIADASRQLIELAMDVQAHKLHCRQQMGLAQVGPVVVHCSAGIGRTGCFIALCIGMRQLSEEHMVDVLGVVCQMRLDRGGMIQTPEQYEFVHYVLALFEQSLVESPCGNLLRSP